MGGARLAIRTVASLIKLLYIVYSFHNLMTTKEKAESKNSILILSIT